MRILAVHNYYQQPGGEDAVFRAEKALLEHAGHQVTVYERYNEEIASYSTAQKLMLFQQTIWAWDSLQAIREILQQERPQVVHFHNTFPLISPAAYYACQQAGVSVVQTLHNYRLLCPNAFFLRDGHICEDCLGKTLPWPGVLHACYRNSRTQSAVVTTMLTVHRWLKTWQKQVNVYIALTGFSRQKFIQGGLSGEEIVVKPNFVHPDPGVREGIGNYALFVGRLSAEKGVHTLLKAWSNLSGIPLKIVGNGPLTDEAAAFVQESSLEVIDILGRRSNREVISLMKGARLLVFPSEWYEGFPMTLAEAFACGTPVVASRLGSMPEIVEDERTGLLFNTGDPDDLAGKVAWLWLHPIQAERMGQEARADFEAKYTAERNYQTLMEIYETVTEPG